MIYLQLLWVYLKIGMFGFGGGYAMLSLIQHEIVDIHHWLTPQQFTDVVASGASYGSGLFTFFYSGVAHFLFLCEVQG